MTCQNADDLESDDKLTPIWERVGDTAGGFVGRAEVIIEQFDSLMAVQVLF